MTAPVEELFHRVADLPSAAREQYFAAHAIDDDTRREVEALIAAEPGATALLEHDIGIAAGRALPRLDHSGRLCGPYRLLEVIGRGGMGAVYIAERVDGEVRQRVAVKLLPPGAGAAQRERFLQERQILASVTHPNIARLLDAGHLAHGQPFLVMEYVDGEPIDLFAARLDLRQKVALSLKVCAAVAHLHRHLIVHRDLKPANILVTADGEPKLLDFGIAKLLDLTTDATLTSMRMLTPAYASPEQIVGGKLSTATDVYSLGAVLYRLTTGHATHDVDADSAAAITSAITTRDATPPSRWTPDTKGDLESILLKALRRDPQDRYETVDHLAEDLQAFLESRPVRARAGDAWYRARRFARRYWMPLAAAVVVAASLATGLLVANRQRAIAQRRFADVRQLSARLFDIDRQVSLLAGSTKARQLIVDTSLEYLRRLAADVHDDPDLALEVATAYMSVARVEGVTSGPNLGQIDEANRDLEIAARLVQSVLAARPGNRAALLRAADIANDRAWLAWEAGHSDDSLALAKEAAAWLDAFAARADDRGSAAVILNLYGSLGHKFMLGERYDEAIWLCRRGSELAVLLGRPADRDTFLMTVSLARRYQGDLDGALEAAREATRLLEPSPTETRVARMMPYVLALAREGWILGEPDAISFGRTAEARERLQRAFEIADVFVHKDPNDEATRSRLFLAGGPLGDLLRRSDPARALAVYDHTLADMNAVRSKFLQLRAINLLTGSSYALRRLGRRADARERLDRAFATLRDLRLYPSPKVEAGSEADAALRALADHEADAGDVSGALQVYGDLRERLVANGIPPDSTLMTSLAFSQLYEATAALHRRQGRADLASALDDARLALWRGWDRKLPHNRFIAGQLSNFTPESRK